MKEYIANSPEKMDLEAIFETYHDKIVAFYEWFAEERWKVHKADYDCIARLEQECKEALFLAAPPIGP